MKQISILSLVLFLISCDENNNEEARPNILLVIADDMGLDASPSYNFGLKKPATPNITNLIYEGIIFDNVWAYPTCTPTRSSIITGKYGFKTGVMNVDDELPLSEPSLFKFFKNFSTYSTAVIGKWHLSKDSNHPYLTGVDFYAGLLTGSVNSYFNWDLTQNNTTVQNTDYITSKFTDIAIEWLNERNDPWFLWLAYNAPHAPFHLPPLSLHERSELPNDQANIDNNPIDYYLSMIEAMDAELGRLIDSLSEDVLENTIIIFLGDNGSPRKVAQGFNSRRVKGTVYQGGISVPMYISGKGVLRKNDREDALINTTDLFSTILDIAGINNSENNDSYSFKKILSEDGNYDRNYIYSEIGDDNISDVAIRDRTHKYIKFGDGSEALYNLSENFLEYPNLLNNPLTDEDNIALNSLLKKLNELHNN